MFSRTKLFTVKCSQHDSDDVLVTINIPARNAQKAQEYFYRDHYWLDPEVDKILMCYEQ